MVVMITILAALAIPLVGRQLRDRRVQQAALQVSSLYQNARTRAMGRGSAILVRYTSAERGRFEILEAQRGLADSPDGLSPAECRATPVPSCLLPNWNGPADQSYRVVGQLNLAQRGEFDRVHVQMKNEAAVDVTHLDVCFTPMGRTFFRVDAAHHLTPLNRLYTADVFRGAPTAKIGRTRQVFVLPNGAARVAL